MVHWAVLGRVSLTSKFNPCAKTGWAELISGYVRLLRFQTITPLRAYIVHTCTTPLLPSSKLYRQTHMVPENYKVNLCNKVYKKASSQGHHSDRGYRKVNFAVTKCTRGPLLEALDPTLTWIEDMGPDPLLKNLMGFLRLHSLVQKIKALDAQMIKYWLMKDKTNVG